MNPDTLSTEQALARRDPLRLLSKLELPLTVCFGKARLTLREVLSLAPGASVELDAALNDYVDIRVNNRLVAQGELVVVDGSYAVKVARLCDDPGVL